MRIYSKKVRFTRGSAGAAIAGPTIEPLKTIDDPDLAPGLEDYSAFGLVDFVILPHCDYSDYKEKYRRIIEKYEGYKFRKLNDKQALFVSGDEVGLIESEQP